jgi:hypothetical protein
MNRRFDMSRKDRGKLINGGAGFWLSRLTTTCLNFSKFLRYFSRKFNT